MKMIKMNKNFTRKIKVDGVFYIVHQDQKNQTLSITLKGDSKDFDRDIYFCSKNGVRYKNEDLLLIEKIFDIAHVDRYMVVIPW